MARFDVYRPSRKHPEISYFLDVQATVLASELETRLVIPLVKLTRTHERGDRIHLVFEIEGVKHIAYVAEMGGVLVERLGARVCSLDAHHNEIVAAIDFLMQGF